MDENRRETDPEATFPDPHDEATGLPVRLDVVELTEFNDPRRPWPELVTDCQLDISRALSDRMPSGEAMVLRLSFGLDGDSHYTTREIAEAFDTPVAVVLQLRARGMAALRSALAAYHFRGDLVNA